MPQYDGQAAVRFFVSWLPGRGPLNLRGHACALRHRSAQTASQGLHGQLSEPGRRDYALEKGCAPHVLGSAHS